jgi:hypothetical protein
VPLLIKILDEVTSLFNATVLHKKSLVLKLFALISRPIPNPPISMMTVLQCLAFLLVFLLAEPATSFQSSSFVRKFTPISNLHQHNTLLRSSCLYVKNSNGPTENNQRKIAKYDNLGEPVYEDELTASGSGINVFGKQIDADPLTVSLLVFAVIAFQFFSVLFFQ